MAEINGSSLLFKKALESYDQAMFSHNMESVFCALHATLTQGEGSHNCLGCNFNDLSEQFGEILKYLAECSNLQVSFCTLFMWLNLFIERYMLIMGVLEVPEKYRHMNFSIFYKIKPWANFQKHPKAFIYTHHPFIECCLNKDIKREPSVTLIDQEFVSEYYTNNGNDENLFKKLENTTKVVVDYPDPNQIIIEFCEQSKLFLTLIQSEPDHIEKLKNRSTLENYFSDTASE